ncbi:hypothetical protein PENTCL1PPCAC_10845 [Pristionchus entomophagus]|uniref:Uncharacterized protein n=1 Tax=Pristionchus entomophagus TaxID=358040 RepID=A0AAV5SZQ0_9BILA|nr:hypothetical protein PENTCL1PPCAC_10845 [Pristionchus entomophagus]
MRRKVEENEVMVEELKEENEEMEERWTASQKEMEELKEKMEEERKIMNKTIEWEMKRMTNTRNEMREEVKRMQKKMEEMAEQLEVKENEMELMRRKVEENEMRMEAKGEEKEKEMEELREKTEVLERSLNEASSEVRRFQDLYEDMQRQYREFQVYAQSQYRVKEDELSAMRERLVELEDYPGKENQAPSAPIDQSSVFERLEEIELDTSIFKNLLFSVLRIFKKIVKEEGTKESMECLVANLESEMIHLEKEWKEMERGSEKNGENLRRIEEERRVMEEEAMRADDGRKKTMNELANLRAELVRVCAERNTAREKAKTLEETNNGLQGQYDESCSVLDEADLELEQLKERCNQYAEEVSEKKRKIRMLMKDLNDMEANLEDQIDKNSKLSRKLVGETTEVENLKKDVRGHKREVDRMRLEKEGHEELIRELSSCSRKLFDVYKKVKGRSEQRQMWLDRCLDAMEKAGVAIGRCERLVDLEEAIRSEMAEFLDQDDADRRASNDIQRQIDSLSIEAENM